MSIGINKLELKTNKEQKEWITKQKDSGMSIEQIEKVIEKQIIKQLNDLNKTFSEKPIKMYTESDISEEIESKTKDLEINKELIPNIIRLIESKKLRYYEVKNLKSENEERILTFGLTHEYFDIVQFREELVPYYSTVYVTVSIQINSPYALVFINGRYDLFGKTRKLLKQLIGSEFNIRNVSWDDKALKEIAGKYAQEIKGINAKNVEGKITETAKASDLKQTKAIRELYTGEVYMISFNFKNTYPGNDISINGKWGWITTSLSDKDVQNFVKTDLLSYSSV